MQILASPLAVGQSQTPGLATTFWPGLGSPGAHDDPPDALELVLAGPCGPLGAVVLPSVQLPPDMLPSEASRRDEASAQHGMSHGLPGMARDGPVCTPPADRGRRRRAALTTLEALVNAPPDVLLLCSPPQDSLVP